MRRVYLAQINNSFGNNAFLPYSAGLLWSMASTNAEINTGYQLAGLLCQRLPIQQTLLDITDPDVLGISCYIWNWRYSMALAREVKSKHPSCLVVLGGPEVPRRSQGFFTEHPYVDVLVHGEGEAAFSEILLARLHGGDLSDVRGISIPDSNGRSMDTPPRIRMDDLDTIPSPYMAGVFDDLMARHPDLGWHASQETHRGCPYSCTFCDWGSAVYTKVRRFGSQRLLDEMHWFSENKIDLLYNCDANYGILERDIDLTRHLAKLCTDTGYPRKFRASYAKKSDDKVFEISGLLRDAGMSKGVTLSLQSLDETTLDNVKRRNIAIADFSKLVSRYRDADIPTYTEMILGLPGETTASWIDGLERLLSAGQHDSINIYPCMVLRNSEMADPHYMAIHGLRTVRNRLASNHGIDHNDDIVEYQDIVVETASMPFEDWEKCYLIGWLIQSLHCLGLTQMIAMDHRMEFGTHVGFYASVLDCYTGTDTMLGVEIARVRETIHAAVSNGRGLDMYDPDLGEVLWPAEEFCFLMLQQDLDRFYRELKPLLDTWMDPGYREQICDFQRRMVLCSDDFGGTSQAYDWHFSEMRRLGLLGMYERLAGRSTIAFEASWYPNGRLMEYAREIIWYGRKQGLHLKRYGEI